VSRTDKLIRWSTAAVVVALALVAGIVSWRHAAELVLAYGESGLSAVLVPCTVDGLIYASSMVLLDCARRGTAVPALARWSLALGIVATLAANVAHGLAHGPVGAIVAAWPAAALVLAYETLMSLIRSAAVPAVPAVPATVSAVLAERSAVPEADPLQDRAAEVFAEQLAAGAVPAVRRIRAELRVGQPRAARIRAHLAELATD
jgi:hypothetical protein